ncbi:BnaC01g27490D [Brassica napus]|uniref:BnaC01g27490D protein n=2 Tax=Brassica TaxID=3705 RepID=A0A078H4M2_BRANA|nr:BnaC01g27490D [Brassica napus]
MAWWADTDPVDREAKLISSNSNIDRQVRSRYAESSWCMDELVNIKKRAEKGKLEVIPIFYKVRAKDVRAQTGKFGDKFWALEKVSSGDQIKKWKDALECISNKMGLSLRDKSSEADFIKGIVKEVERVRTATVRGGAQSHHCIKFIPNKRIKICKKFPEDEAKSVEIAHMNFSNARGEEEQNQEVLVLNHDFVK